MKRQRVPLAANSGAQPLEGERLTLPTPWRVMPNWAETGQTRRIVTSERSK